MQQRKQRVFAQVHEEKHLGWAVVDPEQVDKITMLSQTPVHPCVWVDYPQSNEAERLLHQRVVHRAMGNSRHHFDFVHKFLFHSVSDVGIKLDGQVCDSRELRKS